MAGSTQSGRKPHRRTVDAERSPPAAAPPDPIRVGLADDHANYRAQLRALLEGEADFDVVGEASSPDEVIAICEGSHPHVLLLDTGMTGGRGLEVVERLTSMRLRVRILVLTQAIGRPELVRTLRQGAYGVVLKGTPPDLLFKSIRRVRAGEFWVGRDMVADLVHALASDTRSARPAPTLNAPRPFALTPRELDIVSAVSSGYTNRQMADKLAIAEDTIKHHLTSIFDKTGVSNRLELALFAIHHRLIQPGG
jgi:DNA-binding NarL/FixJ family response regulator